MRAKKVGARRRTRLLIRAGKTRVAGLGFGVVGERVFIAVFEEQGGGGVHALF